MVAIKRVNAELPTSYKIQYFSSLVNLKDVFIKLTKQNTPTSSVWSTK